MAAASFNCTLRLKLNPIHSDAFNISKKVFGAICLPVQLIITGEISETQDLLIICSEVE